MLTRESFLNPPELTRERVEVPALGDFLFVRQLTAGERDWLETRLQRRKGKDVRASIAAFVAVDEGGRRLFSMDDVEALSKMPANALEPIVDAHMRLNATSAQDIEDLEKN